MSFPVFNERFAEPFGTVPAGRLFSCARRSCQAGIWSEAFTGRSAHQVDEFLKNVLGPVLAANPEAAGQTAELSV